MISEAQVFLRPSMAEVAAFWLAGEPIVRDNAEPSNPRTRVWGLLTAHRIAPASVSDRGLCKIAPDPRHHPYPAWWLDSWWPRYALMTRAFEHDGTLASIHAGSVELGANRGERACWPRGCAARGLLFADPVGQAFLRHEEDLIAELGGVLVCRELADFLRWSCESMVNEKRFAVLGFTNGSQSAFAELRKRWPLNVPAYLALGQDDAGKQYERELATILKGLNLRRIGGR